MNFLTSTIAEKVLDPFFNKFISRIRNLKGRRNDVLLKDAIYRQLLDQYGNELFYNNLVSYLKNNKIISQLIYDLRNPSPGCVMARNEFIDQNSKRLLADKDLGDLSQIRTVFSYIFDCVHTAITDVDPYSDAGKIKSELHLLYANDNDRFQSDSGRNNDASTKDRQSISGLFIIDRETVKTYQVNTDSSIIHTYLRISTNIENVLYAVCSDAVIECLLEDKTMTLVDAIQNEVCNGSQAVFLLGNGGIGKSTTLVQTAVRLCESGKNICLFQLGGDFDLQIIHEVLKRISDAPDRNHVLFIDNPYDNSEAVNDLLTQIKYETNVQVVMAERLNRFVSIMEDMLPDLYFVSARIIIPHFGESQTFISKFDGQQISRLQISHEWKQNVVLHMFRSIPNVDMPKIESLIKEQNQMSVIEWYLRTCIEYNKWVDTDSTLSIRYKVKLDWDEWEELFHIPCPQFDEVEAKELQELFQIVAALDIFKIKAGIKLLAQKSNIQEMRLDNILRSMLNAASNEPAIYDNKSEYPHISLKHDMISTLFFDVNEVNPQLILEHIVNVLGSDAEAVVQFEKQVFKRKYIQHGNTGPRGINTVKLYRMFAQNPSYYQILQERNRAYSFDVAGIWQLDETTDKAAISSMWDRLLENYDSAQTEIKNKVIMCCVDDCLRRNIPLPGCLPVEKKTEANTKMAIAKKDLLGITAVWSQRLSLLYENATEIDLISEWRKVVFDYLLYDFEMPEEFFTILAYADYQVVDAAYGNLERYVKRNRLNKRKYFELGIRLYAAIADRQKTDISSRMRLAHCYIENNELRQAEAVYYRILELYPDHLEVNSALGNLCAQLLKTEWKELKDNPAEERRLLETCKTCFERAIKLSETAEDKSICYGAMGWFLYRTMRKYQESYDALQEALKYHEQASTHSQLGMLCSNFNEKNPRFSIEEAKYHFERATSLLKSTDLNLLSVYTPYANLYYYLGEFEKAVDLYQKAEKLGEQKATEMLKRIEEEQEELAKLSVYPLKTMTTLEEACDLTAGDNAVHCKEPEMNEVLSLLLHMAMNEEKSPHDIRLAIKILQNLRNSSDSHKHGIIESRVIQRVETAAISNDICKTVAEKKFRTQCFYVEKACRELL